VRWLALVVALSVTAWLLFAGPGGRPSTATPSSPSEGQSRAAVQKPARAPAAVSTLGKQNVSPYHAGLFVDEKGVVLVTPTGFTHFRDAEAAEEHAMPLGPVAVRQGDSIVFWRSGALRQVSLSGTDERELLPLALAPQFLLASESRLAWIDLDRKTGASLHTLTAGEARVVAEVEERVGAAILRDAVAYWIQIQESRGGSWKIGSIGLDGQQRRVTEAHQGRPPAMLALGPDGVYFYDGPERGVRRLTFELDREDPVATNVICSPLVVSSRAICAQVGGLFEVASKGSVPRFVASEHEGPVTALAATDDRIFWVAEAGKDELVVRSAPLPGL